MMANQENENADEEQEEETYNAREPAWRVFAAEFNDARHEVSQGGERDPTYVVTPLGSRINRLFAVGVLTSNDPVGEEGGVRRAQITDPTGVFHVYAGQYQPEALQALQELEPPAIVAVVGKARTYSPEEGVVYTSIRPETIHGLSSQARDAWILETAEHTLDRIEAMGEALQMEEPTEELLTNLDIPPRLAKGVLEATELYTPIDLDGYLTLVRDALGYLMPAAPEPKMVDSTTPDTPADPEPATGPEGTPAEPATVATTTGQGTTGSTDQPPQPQTVEVPEGADPEGGGPAPDPEAVVFDLVEALDDGDGALWDDIVAQAAEQGIGEEDVEEAMNMLMDRGRVFEPVLGRLKAT